MGRRLGSKNKATVLNERIVKVLEEGGDVRELARVISGEDLQGELQGELDKESAADRESAAANVAAALPASAPPVLIPLPVHLTLDQLAQARSLSESLNCPLSEVFSRGLAMLSNHQSWAANSSQEIAMAGPDPVIQAKNIVLQKIREGCGPNLAASEAGIFRHTMNQWLGDDDVFRILYQEATGYFCDVMVDRLVEMTRPAVIDPKTGKIPKPPTANLCAIQTWLNNFHPDFGFVRAQMIAAILESWSEKVWKIARKFIPHKEQFLQFSREVGEQCSRTVLDSDIGRGSRRK